MLLSYVLLALLFVVGFIGTFLKLPQNNKFTAWFHSLLYRRRAASTEDTAQPSSSASSELKGELESVFATFDKNKDGYITEEELKESLKNIGITMSDKDVKEMVERVDSNGDGLIDLDEFCELFQSMMTTTTTTSSSTNTTTVEEMKEGGGGDGTGGGYLKEAFDVFDADGDGVITVKELGLVLSSLGFKEGKLLESCKEMIRKVDVDGDGNINFDEFEKMMKAGTSLLPIS